MLTDAAVHMLHNRMRCFFLRHDQMGFSHLKIVHITRERLNTVSDSDLRNGPVMWFESNKSINFAYRGSYLISFFEPVSTRTILMSFSLEFTDSSEVQKAQDRFFAENGSFIPSTVIDLLKELDATARVAFNKGALSRLPRGGQSRRKATSPGGSFHS